MFLLTLLQKCETKKVDLVVTFAFYFGSLFQAPVDPSYIAHILTIIKIEFSTFVISIASQGMGTIQLPINHFKYHRFSKKILCCIKIFPETDSGHCPFVFLTSILSVPSAAFPASTPSAPWLWLSLKPTPHATPTLYLLVACLSKSIPCIFSLVHCHEHSLHFRKVKNKLALRTTSLFFNSAKQSLLREKLVKTLIQKSFLDGKFTTVVK